MKRVLFLGLLALILGGCASMPSRPKGDLTFAKFQELQRKREARVDNTYGRAVLRFRTKKNSVAGRARVYSNLSRGFRMELRDPLGRVGFLVTLRGDSFDAFYPTDNRCYHDDSAGDRYVRQFLGMAASFRDLQYLFFGLIPPSLGEANVASWRWNAEESAYEVEYRKGANRAIVQVDPQVGAVERIQVERGNDRIAVRFEDFTTSTPGLPAIPGRVRVEQLSSGSRLEALWDEIEPHKVDWEKMLAWSQPTGCESIRLQRGPDASTPLPREFEEKNLGAGSGDDL